MSILSPTGYGVLSLPQIHVSPNRKAQASTVQFRSSTSGPIRQPHSGGHIIVSLWSSPPWCKEHSHLLQSTSILTRHPHQTCQRSRAEKLPLKTTRTWQNSRRLFGLPVATKLFNLILRPPTRIALNRAKYSTISTSSTLIAKTPILSYRLHTYLT